MTRTPAAPAAPAAGVRLVAALVAAALVAALPLAAQRPPPRDTVVALDELVVTVDRARTPLASSVASVSTLSEAEIEAVPRTTVADALRQVPGFARVGFDGLGHDPQLMVRGFYGGGEAEYVVVLLDGQSLNALRSGLVAWDAIPLAAVERIEVLRGGASALWGDAALAGVVNLVTRAPREDRGQWSLAGGSYGTGRGSVQIRTDVRGRELSLYGGLDRTSGFREHAHRTTGRAGGRLELASGPRGGLAVSAFGHWRDFQVPGPLPGDALAGNRAASHVFHRFDGTEERDGRLVLDGRRRLGEGAWLAGSIAGEMRSSEAVRTLVLAPGFADTKERVLDTGRGGATAQLTVDGTGLPVPDQLILGVDASYGTLESEYFTVVTGGPDQYRTATGERGETDTRGSGHRARAAAFAQYTLRPVEPVRLVLGARMDWLEDGFEPTVTGEDEADAAEALDAGHTAFSPKLGLNVRYLGAVGHTGHVYVTGGRSFKAPTLDQLFDQRRIPVPFPPYAVTTSNPLLDPQRGTSVEAGIYHRATLAPRALTGELTLSVYRMEMEDELDFDLQSLRYVNIGESRHDGVEAGLKIHGPGAGTFFVNYTLQDVTHRLGDHAGNRLKAIPEHFLSAGLDVAPFGRLRAGALVSHARGIWLDDANTLELPAYTTVDARVSHPLGGVRLFLDVRNVFDARYSTTGFPDPSGSGAVYYHPAAGRTFELGLRGAL